MTETEELLKLERALLSLAYTELGVVLHRPAKMLKSFVIRTPEAYEMLKTATATWKMEVYTSHRDALIEVYKHSLQVTTPPVGWTIPTGYPLKFKVQNVSETSITDGQILAASGLTEAPEDYTISFVDPVHNQFYYDFVEGVATYVAYENWVGWDRIKFTVSAENFSHTDYIYMQVVIDEPTDEQIVANLPNDYKLVKDKVEDWIDAVVLSDIVHWYFTVNPTLPDASYSHIEESYDGVDEYARPHKVPYLDYSDTSLRFNQVEGQLIIWDEELKQFMTEDRRDPVGEITSTKIDYDTIEYNGLHYPVTHVTNNWSSLVTSESDNILSRSNVTINLELIKSGIPPTEVYYYRVKFTNNLYNSVIKNVTVSPVQSIDNKPRISEFFLKRDTYANLQGTKLISQLRASILEDLRRVFLVY